MSSGAGKDLRIKGCRKESIAPHWAGEIDKTGGIQNRNVEKTGRRDGDQGAEGISGEALRGLRIEEWP
jgi:hypothetical protein